MPIDSVVSFLKSDFILRNPNKIGKGGRLSIFFLFFCFIFLSGCAVQKRSCPPLASTDEAVAVLKEYSTNLKPLKATGNCTLNYTDEKGEKFAQSFPVRIWYRSNRKFCLYGDIMFDPQAVGFVVSGDQYWSYAKLLKLFTKGAISEETDDYFANPLILTDFLTPVSSDCNNLYLAQSEKKCNILVCTDSECKVKKIFIDRCGHFVKRIEYLTCSGNIKLVLEADEYKKTAGGNFLFPHKLVYKNSDGKKGHNQMQIKLDSVKLWQPQPEQIKALFAPPDMNIVRKEVK